MLWPQLRAPCRPVASFKKKAQQAQQAPQRIPPPAQARCALGVRVSAWSFFYSFHVLDCKTQSRPTHTVHFLAQAHDPAANARQLQQTIAALTIQLWWRRWLRQERANPPFTTCVSPTRVNHEQHVLVRCIYGPLNRLACIFN